MIDINMLLIFDFCKIMQINHNINFYYSSTTSIGKKFIGEYFSQSGKLYSIKLYLHHNKVEICIHDMKKNLVFSDICNYPINNNISLMSFIRKTLLS